MAKSKIIKDLISEKISLSQVLDRMIVIAMELEDESLLQWVKREKEGYSKEDEIPEYRIGALEVIGTYQMVGLGNLITYNNQPLPTMGVPEEVRDTIDKHRFRGGISNILESIESINSGQTVGYTIPPELYYMFKKGTNIMNIVSATYVIDKLTLTNIVSFTKTRMIEVLTMLEKNFGCIDDLDIDINNYDSNEINKLREELMKIIEGKPTGNTYIITKSKIKGSNLGENNTIDKDTSVEVSPSVEVNNDEKKSGFWSWFTHYINHIQDYSYFWFISLYDHYFYTGDISFLRSIFPRAVKALNFCMDQIGDDGFVRGDPYRDWVFIDWVDMPRNGVVSAEQILFCVALKKMAYLAAVLGYKDLSEKFKSVSERLKEAIFKLFYNVEKGFFYNNAVDGKVTGSITVYSNIFAVMYSLVDDTERERIINSAIFAPDVERIKTPYAKLFELIALCEAGKHKEVCDIIRSYWGGMLKNGATSFWEFYDESEHGEDKYAMYDRPYGKSCCHAWGAGPIYINGRYFLGVRPTDVAYKSFSVTPELNDYGCIEGVVPTVNGEISIGMNTRVLKVKSSVDGKGVIYIHKKYNPEIRGELRGDFYSVPINKGEEICVKLNYARNI